MTREEFTGLAVGDRVWDRHFKAVGIVRGPGTRIGTMTVFWNCLHSEIDIKDCEQFDLMPEGKAGKEKGR